MVQAPLPNSSYMETFQRMLYILDATELYQQNRNKNPGSMGIITETRIEKEKANVTCMGNMFGDKEGEKQTRMSSKHANNQLGCSPTIFMDEACKSKHHLSVRQESQNFLSWIQGNNFDTTEGEDKYLNKLITSSLSLEGRKLVSLDNLVTICNLNVVNRTGFF